jgi:DnaJ-class molecular chaperone
LNYKDYYKVLGVEKTAPEKDIKSAYRKLAKKWHPDANAGNAKVAEEKFKEISEAYEVLGDKEKRRKYDELGSDWASAAQQAEAQRRYRQQAQSQAAGDPFANFGANGGGNAGFSDFFDMFFSGVGRSGAGGRQTVNTPPPQRGQDLETPLDVTLADAYNGAKRTVSLQIDDTCPVCHGSGTRGQQICNTCHGTGHSIVTKKFEVSIPKGVRDGQHIRLAGQGGSGAGGGQSGDLHLIVRLQNDKTFERKGDDLYVDAPVSIYDLVLGGEIRVPTMSGDVTMTIPAGTQSNKLLRLSGKGMPKIKGGGSGDQYVRLIGMLPTDLSNRERELFKELATLRHATSSVS